MSKLKKSTSEFCVTGLLESFKPASALSEIGDTMEFFEPWPGLSAVGEILESFKPSPGLSAVGEIMESFKPPPGLSAVGDIVESFKPPPGLSAVGEIMESFKPWPGLSAVGEIMESFKPSPGLSAVGEILESFKPSPGLSAVGEIMESFKPPPGLSAVGDIVESFKPPPGLSAVGEIMESFKPWPGLSAVGEIMESFKPSPGLSPVGEIMESFKPPPGLSAVGNIVESFRPSIELNDTGTVLDSLEFHSTLIDVLSVDPSPSLITRPRASCVILRPTLEISLPFELVPAPQAVGTIEPDATFDPVHGQLFSEFERWLRSVIEEALFELIGPNWIRQRVSQGIREKWQERQTEDCANGRPVFDAVQYADFMDLCAIITRGDNWRDAFQTIFLNRDDISVSFCRLNPVRRALAHSRPLSQMDILTLIAEVSRILNKLGIGALH